MTREEYTDRSFSFRLGPALSSSSYRKKSIPVNKKGVSIKFQVWIESGNLAFMIDGGLIFTGLEEQRLARITMAV